MVLSFQSVSKLHANFSDTYFESPLEDIPELLRLHIARVFNFQIPSLRHNLLGRERSLGVPPSRICPPLLHRRNLVQVLLLLGRWVHRWVIHPVGSHIF